MNTLTITSERLRPIVDRRRLLETAVRLIEVPSRTGEAGAVSGRLAEILVEDGFAVERPEGGHSAAPAVAVRFEGGRPGRVLQFDGHLDIVHLPLLPPRVEGGRLLGSGSSDVKAGIAVAVEALRALRDADALIAEGYVGDAVSGEWAVGRGGGEAMRELDPYPLPSFGPPTPHSPLPTPH